MLKVLKLVRLKGPECEPAGECKPSKLELLAEQLLDSVIVGGIAGFSAYLSNGADATLTSFGIAFGITFLIKMKDYRKIA